MADLGSFDLSQFKELQKKINKLKNNKEAFFEACIKMLAAELLKRTIKRTPVGDYRETVEKVAKRTSKNHKKGEKYYIKKASSGGKNGGTLRKGWNVTVKKNGNMYTAVISNPVKYAPYVEYGHRQTPGRYVPAIGKKLKSGWVQGKFMLTISEQELQEIAPEILKKKLNEFLGVIK